MKMESVITVELKGRSELREMAICFDVQNPTIDVDSRALLIQREKRVGRESVDEK